MKKTKLMKISAEFSYETITGLFVTALEGGSNYWYYLNDEDVEKIRLLFKKGSSLSLAEKITIAVLEKGYTVRVTDAESEDDLGIISKDGIREGFALMLKAGGSAQKEAISRIICDAYDADDADVWLQMVVMKEIVYG